MLVAGTDRCKKKTKTILVADSVHVGACEIMKTAEHPGICIMLNNIMTAY